MITGFKSHHTHTNRFNSKQHKTTGFNGVYTVIGAFVAAAAAVAAVIVLAFVKRNDLKEYFNDQI